MGTGAVSYPAVKDEFETVRMLAKGKSIARLGDGELKLIGGGGAAREPANPALANELLEVLHRPHRDCLVGIPTMDTKGAKYANWSKHLARFSVLLSQSVTYYSAFISRPDSAQWIESYEFADSVRRLWAGKRTAVVCERKGSIFRVVAPDARQSVHIECPKHRSYEHLDWLEKRVLRADPQIAVLSVGPAATCLANRLAGHGIQALDLGSAGKFLFRNLWPSDYARRFPEKR
jgi:hypothetical protein